jgi:hypothetical protein
MKVLINSCYGGFSFSNEFVDHINELMKDKIFNKHELWERSNPFIVEQAELFGLDKASGMCADLTIKTIPDGLEYSIHEYDGCESIDYTYLIVHPDELVKGLSPERLELAKKASFIKMLNKADYWNGDGTDKVFL